MRKIFQRFFIIGMMAVILIFLTSRVPEKGVTTFKDIINPDDIVSFMSMSKSKSEDVVLDDVLQKDGYIKTPTEDANVYMYTNDLIQFTFDRNKGIIKKGDFTFYLRDQYAVIEDIVYIDAELLSKIINKNISIHNGEVNLEPLSAFPHKWTTLNQGLVAHGGGGVLDLAATNCYEAIITNYNQGHTVFEIDLNFTTDQELVAVHDWVGYAGIKSSEEFKNIKIADVFKSLDLDDIYEIMMLNQDFYLITDTKSFEYSDEETVSQFKQIVEKASKYDQKLLDRIVPQVYNQEMYRKIKEIYPFNSIIYTLYASDDTDAQVIDFVKAKDDIKVITMAPSRFSKKFRQGLGQYDKLIYLFTLNDSDEIQHYRQKGVYGFYTDFVIPKQ